MSTFDKHLLNITSHISTTYEYDITLTTISYIVLYLDSRGRQIPISRPHKYHITHIQIQSSMHKYSTLTTHYLLPVLSK